ncbi:MAG TPA: FecR domain-containing protein, partial [Pyrinomonadaceae bacterium]|nr:FecR domain-containing protein [Pyrinomonadaceae bacterium]
MKPTKHQIDRLLDDTLAEVRREELAAGEVEAAAGRVWARLGMPTAAASGEAVSPSSQISGCVDYQSLIPAYLARQLSEARTLLLEDHTLECLPCRRALKDARAAKYGVAAPAAKNVGVGRTSVFLRQPIVRFALAASIILVFGLAIVPLIQKFVPWGSGIDPVVQAVNGAVFLVDDAQSQSVAAGNNFKKGERIRTAKEAGAVVRLADGSLVEMRERSEFSVSENLQGATIHLDRGSIIVQAAKQRGGKHLYVATDDCLVSVKGTIFSVNSGMKGSRVSVAEGEVDVDHRGAKSVLRPGEQVTTSDNLEPVPVREEFAWSRDADRYAKLLAGLEDVRRNLETRVTVPGVRYSTRLLDLAPAETVLYVAIPNVSETIAQSYQILQERIAQNEALREWWGQEDKKHDAQLKELVEKVRQFGSYLGSEVTVSVGLNADGRPADPLVVGELKDAAGFQDFLRQEMNRLAAKGEGRSPGLRFVADPLAADLATPQQTASPELYIWVRDDLFAISPRLAALQQLATNLQSPAANPFRETPFRASVADVYQHGAGFVLAADLQKILARSLTAQQKGDGAAPPPRAATFDRLGLTTLKYLIVELKQQDGQGSNRAVLSFTEPRRGVASWLAAPGPMGALEYISPEANMVAAFVVKEPAALVDDLLSTLQTIDPSIPQHLDAFERESGFSVRGDFAAPLGGEFAFAVDGPLLPTPSWKMIMEVYDQRHLQGTFESVVGKLNAWAAEHGQKGLTLTASGGSPNIYTLRSVDFGLEVHYTFAEGYLIAAPTTALLTRALQYRESGVSLVTSARFTSALPEDG